ncbi:hypothetical protein M427DRAFT_489392 [Gonapodya prolifera JEL478]|uniref:Uncharacterized protein n=1 Tax=Gonapodya prolifera (strain JEL478) TaxID=1344416 RepID=A0A139AP20_GONPJ|nr:hypothetical protein M427DRAFT_489392 [Gonapodya prolifera JEL478]|eukprot:KXS18490.1 hypothetical protein M427DRAFT_489392 [Gonapodya prolifera JEL478]
MPSPVSARERLYASCRYLRHEKGLSIPDLQKTYSICRRTVFNWLATKPGGGDRPEEKPTGKRPKCSSDVEEVECRWMCEDVVRRQIDCVDMVRDWYGVTISHKTVSDILRRHDVTKKTVSYSFCEQEGRQENVRLFQETMQSVFKQTWAAMDGCEFYLNETPRFRYSKKGTPVVADRPKGRGDYYVLFLCIRSTPQDAEEHTPVVAWTVYPTYANAQRFKAFLERGIGSPPNLRKITRPRNRSVLNPVAQSRDKGKSKTKPGIVNAAGGPNDLISEDGSKGQAGPSSLVVRDRRVAAIAADAALAQRLQDAEIEDVAVHDVDIDRKWAITWSRFGRV